MEEGRAEGGLDLRMIHMPPHPKKHPHTSPQFWICGGSEGRPPGLGQEGSIRQQGRRQQGIGIKALGIEAQRQQGRRQQGIGIKALGIEAQGNKASRHLLNAPTRGTD